MGRKNKVRGPVGTFPMNLDLYLAGRRPPEGDLLLDQTPAFDPTEAEPIFDQSLPDEFDD